MFSSFVFERVLKFSNNKNSNPYALAVCIEQHSCFPRPTMVSAKGTGKKIWFASGNKNKTKQDTASISLFLYTLYQYYLITSDVWCPTENNGTFQMGAARFKAHTLRASQICKSLNLDYMLEIVSIKSHLTQFRLTQQSSIFY